MRTGESENLSFDKKSKLEMGDKKKIQFSKKNQLIINCE